MILQVRKTFRSWMFLYAGFIAALALANQAGGMDYSDAENLSPVMIGADAPALTIDEIVRRSDI